MAVETLILAAAWNATALLLLLMPQVAAQSIQPRSRK
jgi:hypothetical protein